MKKLPSQLTTSERGVQFIKKWEAYRAKMYYCPAGKPTIGYGHVIRKNERHLMTATLSPAQALELLRKDIAIAEAGVRKLYKVALTQGQFDALVDLVFNVGTAIAGFGIVTKVNAGKSLASIKTSYMGWINVRNPKTKVLEPSNGLINRRTQGWAIFVS